MGLTEMSSALRLDRETVIRFGRFLVVGFVNMLFGYSVFAVLILFGLGPELALALSFIIGVLWNYITTARFVFQVQGYGRFPGFAATYIGVYILNVFSLNAMIDAGLSSLISQAILTPPASILTFGLLSFVMRERPKD